MRKHTPSISPPYAVLAAVCLAALVLPLSFAGAAVATPAIARELGSDPAALNWITNAFMLTFGSCLMAAGALADQFGRRRVFAAGLTLFAAVSLGLSLAPDMALLNGLRAAQGVAAAAALAGGSAALAQAFEGRMRARAFSLLGTTFGLGLAFGPVLAGLTVGSLGWRWVFLATAAVAALALCLGVPRMRESRDPQAAGLDVPGSISFTLALALFTFGVLQAPVRGWGSGVVLMLLMASVLMLALFVAIEWRTARPMLDLSLLRYPRFVGVQLLPIATCCCYVVLLVLLPARFIGIEQRVESQAGLMMVALSLPMLFMPSVAVSLARRWSAAAVSAAGLVVAALGLLALSRVPLGADGVLRLLPMLVIGLGSGLPWGLMDGLSVAVVPKERSGMAAGIFGTVRVAGEGVALALCSALLPVLIDRRLEQALRGAPAVADAGVALAAQRLASGGIDSAQAVLPTVDRLLLSASYAAAFQNLCVGLALITLLCAGLVFLFLSEKTQPASSAASFESSR